MISLTIRYAISQINRSIILTAKAAFTEKIFTPSRLPSWPVKSSLWPMQQYRPMRSVHLICKKCLEFCKSIYVDRLTQSFRNIHEILLLFLDYIAANLDMSQGQPVCSICGMAFTIITNARRHVRSVHFKEGHGSFDCSVCGKKFDRIRSLGDHMRKAHNVYKYRNY